MTTQTMTKNDIPWWIPLIQGIASIILGFMLVTSTGRTIFFLVTFIGIYWLVDGFSPSSPFFLTAPLGAGSCFAGCWAFWRAWLCLVSRWLARLFCRGSW